MTASIKCQNFGSGCSTTAKPAPLKFPLKIMEEMKQGRVENDLLYDWICRPEIEAALLLAEAVDESIVAHVVAAGYAPDLTDSEIEYLGRDPFLVAYALVNPSERCIVGAWIQDGLVVVICSS